MNVSTDQLILVLYPLPTLSWKALAPTHDMYTGQSLTFQHHFKTQLHIIDLLNPNTGKYGLLAVLMSSERQNTLLTAIQGNSAIIQSIILEL